MSSKLSRREMLQASAVFAGVSAAVAQKADDGAVETDSDGGGILLGGGGSGGGSTTTLSVYGDGTYGDGTYNYP